MVVVCVGRLRFILVCGVWVGLVWAESEERAVKPSTKRAAQLFSPKTTPPPRLTHSIRDGSRQPVRLWL